MGELLTATEASRRYSISERTIRTWIRVGKLPGRKTKIDGLDSWQIDTDEIEKAIARKKAGKLNASTLPEVFARMEVLESKIAGLEEQLAMMTSPQLQEPHTSIVEANRDSQPLLPSQTRLTPGITTLPDGYRGFTEFFKSHGIAETTANRAAQAGIFHVLTNGWKIDGVSVRKVLDPEAQQRFCLHFCNRSTSFHECDTGGCPCQQIIKEIK